MLRFVVAAFAVVLSTQAFAVVKTYGAKITDKSTLALSQAVSAHERYADQQITVAAKVKQVCQKKGCWMVLESAEGKSVRVLFANYGFFVDKDLKGATIRAQGKLVEKKIPESDARHFLEDEGAPATVIEAVKGEQTVLQFIADGVEVTKA